MGPVTLSCRNHILFLAHLLLVGFTINACSTKVGNPNMPATVDQDEKPKAHPEPKREFYLMANVTVGESRTEVTVTLMDATSKTKRNIRDDESCKWDWDSAVDPISIGVIGESTLKLSYHNSSINSAQIQAMTIKYTYTSRDGEVRGKEVLLRDIINTPAGDFSEMATKNTDKFEFTDWNGDRWMEGAKGESCVEACARRDASFDPAGYAKVFPTDGSAFFDECHNAYDALEDLGLFSDP
ncbi:MAG: hypothetical protein CMP10_01505, partial [Zetaproteobacteria bacterium]|nr:hypothetical protein [Pseudobdellovibrionaceae bacterium]